MKKELSIHSYGDLAHLFPNRYIDKTKFYKINELAVTDAAQVQVIGKIVNLRTAGTGKAIRLVASFSDGTGSMELVWFNG